MPVALTDHPSLYRVGDAMCTIAACTSFPEPFVTPQGMKRLPFSHKRFAGHRASDHLAMLNAFYQWERTRYMYMYTCVYIQYMEKNVYTCNTLAVRKGYSERRNRSKLCT